MDPWAAIHEGDAIGRPSIGIDLSGEYCAMARERVGRETAQVRLPVEVAP